MNRRSLITLLTALLMCATTALADAAETTNPLDEINSIADSVCSVGRYSIPLIDVDVSTIFGWAGVDVNDVLFFCNYASLLRKAEDYGNGLMEGAGNTARRLGVDILERTVRNAAGSVGDEAWQETLAEEIETAKEQVDEAMNAADDAFDLEAYRLALLEAIDQAEENARAQLRHAIQNPEIFPEGSEERAIYEGLKNNVAAQIVYEGTVTDQFDLAREQAKTATPFVGSQQAAEAFMQNDAYTQTVAGVVRPHNSEDGPGTAAQLEEAASNATSTREVLNEMSRGWADYMRQDAVLTANVIEGLRASVQQQTMTNWQLHNLAEAERQKQLDAIEDRQRELEEHVKSEHEEMREAFQGLLDLANAPNSLFGTTAHPDYCETRWCPPGAVETP